MTQTETTAKQETSQLRNVILAVILLFAMNIGFLVASWLTGANRPLVNLDYAFAITLISFGFPILGLTAGLLFLFFDILVLAGQLFPFPRISDFLYLLKFTALTSTEHLLLIIGALATLLFKLAILYWSGKRISRLSSLATLNLLLAATSLILINDNEETRYATYRRLTPPAVGSLASSLFSMRSSSFLSNFEGTTEEFSPSGAGATLPWLNHATDAIEDRLLLIIVESWGVTKNPEINNTLLSPLRSMTAETIESGEIKFDGFTITGELRELCQLKPSHFNLRDTETGFENCLPNRLQALGYMTAAMHGATSLMYDRRHWYPRAGFQKTTFFEDRIWPRRCHSFPGACDYDMLSELERFFDEPGKRFMYWLTLNTHAPYDLRDLRDSQNPKFECEKFDISEDTETCRLLKLQAEFFNNLAESLVKAEMMNTDIIIVGDHAPKLSNLQEREASFLDGPVPWIRIKTQSQ